MPKETTAEAIKDFVENEKWPQGTYSFLGLHVEDRLAVLATQSLPWVGAKTRQVIGLAPSRFALERVPDGVCGLHPTMVKFEASREDGLKDVVYSQVGQLPAWVEEPNGAGVSSAITWQRD